MQAFWLDDEVVHARKELEAEGIEMLGEVEWLSDIPGFEAIADYGWFTFRGPTVTSHNWHARVSGHRRACEGVGCAIAPPFV